MGAQPEKDPQDQPQPEVLEDEPVAGTDLDRVADPSDRGPRGGALARNFPSLQGMSLDRLGEVFAQSGYFRDAQDPAKAMVKIIAGAELGLSPFASMTGIHLISGKPVVGGQLLAGILRSHPRYRYEVVQWTAEICEVAMFERDPATGEWRQMQPNSTYTLEDAATAQLLNKDNWKHHPRNMLLWRAMLNAVRLHTPDIFGGTPVYTPDEMGVQVEADGSVRADDGGGRANAPSGRTALPPRATGGAQPRTISGTAREPEQSEPVITAAQKRKLWAEADKAGIKGDEQLLRALMLDKTGVEHSDRIQRRFFNDLLEAIADHEAAVDYLMSRAAQGEDRARRIVERAMGTDKLPDVEPAPEPEADAPEDLPPAGDPPADVDDPPPPASEGGDVDEPPATLL